MDKYQLIVSEPWDFKNSQGNNRLSGKIVKEVDDETVVFESDEVVKLNNVSGTLLVASTRYQKEKIKNGSIYKATVNVAILLTQDYEAKDSKTLKENSKFVMIGSLSPH